MPGQVAVLFTASLHEKDAQKLCLKNAAAHQSNALLRLLLLIMLNQHESYENGKNKI